MIQFTRELHKEVIYELHQIDREYKWTKKEEAHKKATEKLLKEIGGVCPDQDMLISHFGGGNY